MIKFTMPPCPALPLPPSKNGHFMMHCTPSWETDLSILRQYKENLVGVLQMSWHHFLFCIFRMKSWKNFINTSLIIPKLCPFSWAFFFFKLPFSFYQLNSALPHPPRPQSLKPSFICMKGPPPGVSWLGWNWAAGYTLLKGQLRYWCMEGTWFVKTGEMIVYKSKDMERKPVLKEKLSHSY